MRLEGRLTLLAVAGDKARDPSRRDLVGPGDLAHPTTLDDDCGDHQAGT
jgi:hypothetical protein